MQRKWKYAKPRKEMGFDEYLVLPLDKKFRITVKNWNISGAKSGHGSVFRTDVIEVNGKKDNRMLVIRNYGNVIELKKGLAKKTSVKSTAELEITRKYDEDEMEHYFDIKFLN